MKYAKAYDFLPRVGGGEVLSSSELSPAALLHTHHCSTSRAAMVSPKLPPIFLAIFT